MTAFQVVVMDIPTLAEADAIADAVVVLLYDLNPDNVVTVSFGDDAEGSELQQADGAERGLRRNVTASSPNPVCIVCPHRQSEHVYRDENSWCQTCNADDMAGPCSAYFMGQHAYMPSRHEPQRCGLCRLAQDNRGAHPFDDAPIP